MATSGDNTAALPASRAWTPRFDDGPYARARIGFIAVANAGLTEGEMFAMCPPGVGLSFARVRMATTCTVDSLAGMESDLNAALVGLAPGRDDLDVICYNCTAGSFVIGEANIRAKIEAGRSRVKGTTLLTGVVSAMRALEVKRLVIGTAYTRDIDQLEYRYFREQGFDVTDIQGLGLLTDMQMNRVTPDFLVEFATALNRPDADAIFLSCGALRSSGVIDSIERATGKPALCSNQASMWHCLRKAGIRDKIDGFGRLFQL